MSIIISNLLILPVESKMQNNSNQPEVHVDENIFNHVIIKGELY